jgi:hypothetical protein
MRWVSVGWVLWLYTPLVFSQDVDSSKLVPVEFDFTRTIKNSWEER